jgi:NADH-quinone oxidoreductase subunit L
LFEAAPAALTVVVVVGATTAFFAATVGLVQNDIKRVIAYSTCSQLGYMFVALGSGAYGAGIFHLFTHAFFKALLFLGAGAVIHAMHHEQDIRKMGGLAGKIPFTTTMMAIGTLALTGFPLTAGYFSKDAIIEAAFASKNFYSWRLFFLTFTGKPRWGHDAHGHDAHGHGKHSHDAHSHGDHGSHEPHEAPFVMLLPLLLLAIGALVAGLVFAPAFIGESYDHFWKGALFTGEHNHILHEMHDVPAWVKYSPFVMMILGFLLAFLFYVAKPHLPRELAESQPILYRFLLNKWYFDEIYDFVFVNPAKVIGRFLWKKGDGRVIDGVGPDGVAARVADVAAGAVRLQTGYLYHYAFAMLIGLAVFVTWYMFGGAH